MGDVVKLARINIGVESTAALCPWQMQQLDPTLDGTIAGDRDYLFLKETLLNNLRFLVNTTADVSMLYIGSQGDLELTVRFFDQLSEPAVERTKVRMELAYADHEGDAVYSVGLSGGVAESTGHWLADAAPQGDGRYKVAVRPRDGWTVQTRVEVAIMVETVDFRSVTSTRRRWPFLGSSA